MEKTKGKRTTLSVSFEAAEVKRAEDAVAVLRKRPEYKHLRLRTTDVIRMAAGLGLDQLEARQVEGRCETASRDDTSR